MNDEETTALHAFTIGHASAMAKLASFDEDFPTEQEWQCDRIWQAILALRDILGGHREGFLLLQRKFGEFQTSLEGIGEPLDRDVRSVLRLPFPLNYWPDPWVKLGVAVANWEYEPSEHTVDILYEMWAECRGEKDQIYGMLKGALIGVLASKVADSIDGED